jgi:hypothetical protein
MLASAAIGYLITPGHAHKTEVSAVRLLSSVDAWQYCVHLDGYIPGTYLECMPCRSIALVDPLVTAQQQAPEPCRGPAG